MNFNQTFRTDYNSTHYPHYWRWVITM